MTWGWQVGAIICLMCTFWIFVGQEKNKTRSACLLGACLVLPASWFFDGIVSLILICLAEGVVVIDRFVRLKMSRDINVERELSGLFFYILPLFVFLATDFSLSPDATSYTLVAFFIIRLLRWPLRMPFEEIKGFEFHNFYVLFWCNMSLLFVCQEFMLTEHISLFLIAGLINATVGFSVGAAVFLFASLAEGLAPAIIFMGPIGLTLALGRSWAWLAGSFFLFIVMVNFSLVGESFYIYLMAIVGVFFLVDLYGKNVVQNRINRMQKTSVLLVILISVSASLVPHLNFLLIISLERMIVAFFGVLLLLAATRLRKFFPGVVQIVQMDWQRTFFRYLSIQRIEYGAAPKVSYSELDELAEPLLSRGLGTFGKYLLWMFVLVFVLLLSEVF